MIQRFEIELLVQAYEFLKKLNLKHRKKIIQNMDRAKFHTDPKLFKKLDGEIWEFRTLFSGIQYRLLSFLGQVRRSKDAHICNSWVHQENRQG